MSAKKKAALMILDDIDLSADFQTLDTATAERIAEAARKVGYRKSKKANGSTARCFFEYLARKPKTELLYVIQGDYGQGWEDLTAFPMGLYKEARADLRAYRDNDARAPFRMIRRREKIEQ